MTLSANPAKWSNTLKQFVGCLTVFNHFVGLVLKGLKAASGENDMNSKYVVQQQLFLASILHVKEKKTKKVIRSIRAERIIYQNKYTKWYFPIFCSLFFYKYLKLRIHREFNHEHVIIFEFNYQTFGTFCNTRFRS